MTESSLRATGDENENENENENESDVEGKIELGPQFTIKEQLEKDKDDESLRKWKEQLLGSVDINSIGETPEPEVKILSLAIKSPGRPDIFLPVPESGNPKGLWFTLKEGSRYSLKFAFQVTNNIVSGLKYSNTVWKTGVKVDSTKEMLGMFSPQLETYTHEMPEETTPSGVGLRVPNPTEQKSKIDTHDKLSLLTSALCPRRTCFLPGCTLTTVRPAAGAISGKRLSEGQFNSGHTFTRHRSCRSVGSSPNPTSVNRLVTHHHAAGSLVAGIWGCQWTTMPCKFSCYLTSSLGIPIDLCLLPELRCNYRCRLLHNNSSVEMVVSVRRGRAVPSCVFCALTFSINVFRLSILDVFQRRKSPRGQRIPNFRTQSLIFIFRHPPPPPPPSAPPLQGIELTDKDEDEKRRREGGRGGTCEKAETVRAIFFSISSPSPPRLAFDNALLPLASYDDDDEEEDDDERRGASGVRVGNNVGRIAQNGPRDGSEYDDEDEDDDDGEKGLSQGKRNRVIELRRDCPYLDTVNRQIATELWMTRSLFLDFDFEKFCSVSLSNLNVYACLVCGKYYQGRGQKSHAYTHSLEAGHHVYINLRTEKVYCLPDGYEINDPSLDDIRHVLNPRGQVEKLDRNKQWSRALDGSDYLPGMVGLNNIKETDFVNVTIQSLMRVTPLRNFFLIPENYQHSKSPLVHRFGELTRKIWHARNFKGQVSPHEFLQAVMKASKKRFRIGAQSDPVEFISWLLNTLHADLRNSKRNSSIIHQCFQGELEVVKELHGRSVSEKRGNSDEQNNGSAADGGTEHNNIFTETSRMPFLMLGLDLPPPPLFQDVMEKNIIPQPWWDYTYTLKAIDSYFYEVPLFNILKKFDGESITEVVRPHIARMRYRVTKLPQYIILHMRRFTKNNFFVEKNPTLVNFPVKNLELKDYIPLPTPKENQKLRSKYDLIANIVHDGKPGEGSYRVFVQRKSEELWYEMQDLHVSETLPQMVALSETYMQIYEQQN
ncbi:ubiquitin C-terminal hydrolases superfamily protein [Actinidia rufa]|uniref:Ubiquitin C-terminal hydrolases superfamily protein n=1 Tax=Actinidia rufa TaxID=165716 RepID=A0A7J0GIK7_9ERIC|nr:ubiquitin C-terminal hydrolases superfamily protein [Actinidia rufa]